MMWMLALFACEPVNGGGECTTEAVASVNLTVLDDSGAPIDGASVTWQRSDTELAPCDAFGDGRYACGWEEQGEISVHVEADGFAAWDGSVTVGPDETGCHVLGEALIAELASVDCGDDVTAPAVRATVQGAGGELLSGVLVQWSDPNADMAPQDCGQDEIDPKVWLCTGYVGEMEVSAIADGHAGQLVLVTVDGGACDPVTEDVQFELQPLTD